MRRTYAAFVTALSLGALSLSSPALAAGTPKITIGETAYNAEDQTASSDIKITGMDPEESYNMYTYLTCPESEQVSEKPAKIELNNKSEFDQSISFVEATELENCKEPGFLIKLTDKSDEVITDKASPKLEQSIIDNAPLGEKSSNDDTPSDPTTSTETSTTSTDSSSSTPSETEPSETTESETSSTTQETTSSEPTVTETSTTESSTTETSTTESSTTETETSEPEPEPSARSSERTSTESSVTTTPSSPRKSNSDNTQELNPEDQKKADEYQRTKSTRAKASTETETSTATKTVTKAAALEDTGKLLVNVVNQKGEPVSGVALRIVRVDKKFTEKVVSVGQTSTLFVPVGKFSVERVGVPNGYSAKRSTSKVIVTVKKDKTTKVTFTLVKSKDTKNVKNKPVKKQKRDEILSVPSGPIEN